MKRSFFFKIFLGFFLIVFVLTAYILLFSFGAIEHYFEKAASRELENLGTSLLLTLAPLYEKREYDSLDRIVKQVGRETDRRITIIGNEGTVYADSEADPAAMENHWTRPETQAALMGRTGTDVRLSSTLKDKMLYVAIPIRSRAKEGVTGALRVSIHFEDLKNLLRNLKLRIFFISAIIVVLSLAGAFLFSAAILNPVRQLIEAARRVALGDFSARVFLEHEDELKVLADTYNFMTEKIKGYVSELSGQKEELNTIISSMQPGLLVIDKDGRIRMSNGSAERLLGAADLTGKRYWEVIAGPELFAFIEGVQTGGRNAAGEVQMNASWFQVSAAYIEPMKETVLILNDITDLKNLEKIKRDFVLNVSHELRTPLTAIKGYAQTIEGIGSENEKYLDVIKRHTERLINVVQDLLALSEMEEKGAAFQKEPLRLDAIASQVFRMFEGKVKEKGLEFEITAERGLPVMTGDPLKMEQLFINLVDNAVKYTEKGTITVSLRAAGRELEVVVQDTGIGIPERHLSRIFERFYTVDKSHSRKMGGTGLGLSIVKHVVLLHGGTIGVRSSPGEGTAFTIRFPLTP